MKVTLAMVDGTTTLVSPSLVHGRPGIAYGSCPKCNAEPFEVRGRRARIASDDRAYESEATCVACGSAVGVLRAEMDTMFGLLEDSAVLEGRPRVYG